MKALLLLALLVGCAKEKTKTSTVTVTSTATSAGASALSSNKPCDMMNCVPVSKDTSATATSTGTTTSTDTAPPVTPLPKPAMNRPLSGLLEDATAAAQNVKLTCQNGDCNPSVGYLSILVNNDGIWTAGQCTASLIGPDLLVTNAHCIPDDLSENGSSCANRMWITFADDPQHSDYDKMVGCAKMLYRYREGGMDGADFAYLQLQRPSNRPYVHQSQAGFENNKIYHLHKINPVPFQPQLTGEFVKVDCRSLYDSAIFDERIDSQSLTSFFVDCPVMKGNSGSPILDDQGNVRGVIYAFINKKLMISSLSRHGSRVPKEDDIADINVGSNFACLPLPNADPHAIPAACGDVAKHLADRKAKSDEHVLQQIKPAVDAMMTEKEKGHTDVLAFGWTFDLASSEALGIVAHGRPECLKAKTSAGKSGKIHRPFFYVKADFDKYLAMSNPEPVWAGFAATAENLTVGKAAAGKFPVTISTVANGEKQFDAALDLCR